MRDFDPPVIINCRDRVTPLRALVEWLERAGHERIILLDNASTYEPLIEYLATSPHTVHRLRRNLGSRALWADTLIEFFRHKWFVYTDSDVLPIDDCPFDVVDRLREALELHSERTKAALGLYLDDLPADHRVGEWERRLLAPLATDEWRGYVGKVDQIEVFDSLSDTTFALYRPGSPFRLQALRLGWPYQLRHGDWYKEGLPLSDEDAYYLERAEGANTAPDSETPLDGHIIGSSWKDTV